MISRSNPSLTPGSEPKKPGGNALTKSRLREKAVNEKGDADSTCPRRNFELARNAPAPRLQAPARRQRSAPMLSDNAVVEPNNGPPNKETSKAVRPLSAAPITPSENKALVHAVERSSSSESNLSPSTSDDVTPKEPVCKAIQKDPKLKSLCISLGINQSPNTLVGPIEKGQLIIGTLQDSLRDFIKMKIKTAERKGDKFHIQQSGLDVAMRALRNAERSLKTIKESKQPILGRARQQRSSESLLKCNRKTTEAVIRILSGTKEKFEKMENGSNRFLRGISLVSAYMTSSPSPPSSTGISSYATRRTSGTSILTTPVTPYSSTTAACSRARTATSSTSLEGGCRVGNLAKGITYM